MASKIHLFAKAHDSAYQQANLSRLKLMPAPVGADNCLSGISFALTGTLPAMTRAQAKGIIEKYGGTFGTTVTKQTNIVIRGYEELTSRKLLDAEKKGLPITDQEGFFAFINSTNPNQSTTTQDSIYASTNETNKNVATNQANQIPTTNQTHQIPTTNQSCQIPTTNQTNQIPTTNASFKFPTNKQDSQIQKNNQANQISSANALFKFPQTNQASQSQTANALFKFPQADQIPATSKSFVFPTNDQTSQIQTANASFKFPTANQTSQNQPNNQANQIPSTNKSFKFPTNNQTSQNPATNSPFIIPTTTQESIKIPSNNESFVFSANKQPDQLPSIKEFIEKRKDLQIKILSFLDDSQNNAEENFQLLIHSIENQKISANKHDLTDLLHLVTKIANNHFRCADFFLKIEKIINLFKNDIQKYFTNFEIFNIFKSNKRILLFLIEERIMTIDLSIAKRMTTRKFIKAKYPQYFAPEIKPFLNEIIKSQENGNNTDCDEEVSNDWINEINSNLPKNFNEKRKIGENDSFICKFIQKDMIKEFISYVNKNNISLNTTIKQSIYETNPFLIKKQLTLIQYASFYGSIQIFNYLKMNNSKLTPSLWPFAIHGKNAEIIHALEEHNIKPKSESFSSLIMNSGIGANNNSNGYKKVFIESIKCHHLDVSNYLLKYAISNHNINSQNFIQCIKYHNYAFMPFISINESSFGFLCEYDHYTLVDILLKEKEIDININRI